MPATRKIRRPESGFIRKPPGPKPRFSPAELRRLWYEHENGATFDAIAKAFKISRGHAFRLVKAGGRLAEQIEAPRFTRFRPERTKGPSVDLAVCPNCRQPILVGDYELCLNCMDNGFRHLDSLRRPSKPPKDPEPPDEPKKRMVATPDLWEVCLPDGRKFRVEAMTRSEARAGVKATIGLKPKDGLPKGTLSRRITDNRAKKARKPKS